MATNEYRGQSIVGTQLVFSIKLSLPAGMHMSDVGVNFSAEFYVTKSHSVTIQKSGMVMISNDEYSCVVNTATMSRGAVNCEISVTLTEGNVQRTEKIIIREIERLY